LSQRYIIINSVEIYNKDNIDSLKWPENREGEFARNYLYHLVKQGTLKYVDNIDVEIQVIIFANHLLPISVSNMQPTVKNSYVCSPTSHYIDYGKVEADIELNNKRLLKNLSHLFLNTFNYLFNKLSFEKVIYVNNWLLSTNLYNEMDLAYLEPVRDFLVKTFPGYAVIFRSVNDMYNVPLYDKLKELNFHHVFSRQVYILNTANTSYKKKDSYRKDLKVKKRTAYYWEEAAKILPADISRLRWLYDALYIEKYSPLNPMFNENFIAETLNNKCITYKVLKKAGEIYAVIGYIECSGVITAPVFGYDTSLPATEGLYRLAALRILEDAEINNWIVHMSSGVSRFKLHRGAEASIEYNMVYYAHLPRPQRIPWKILEKFTDYLVIPVMKKYRL
jgi:hypothetical protein